MLLVLEGRNLRKFIWGYTATFQSIDIIICWTWQLISLSYTILSFLNLFINKLLLPFSSVTSIIGFMLLTAILFQLISGFFLAWYYIPEPGLVVELREEMFNDTRYGVEVFWMHLRGVDSLMLLSYMHILKKIYLKNYITSECDGWLLGGYAFFFFHYIVALGICLSGSHLSDLTLTIIANITWSLTNNTHKTYYVIFTNKHLNIDQLTRCMVLHYFTPWYYVYLVKLHVLFCHESWDADSGEALYEDRSSSYIAWFFDAFLKEIQDGWYWSTYAIGYFFGHHFDGGTVNFFFFERWNIAEFAEIRFYGVAPHWYFRPFMGLLTIAPTHFEGLMWFGLWLGLLAFLPVINNFYHPYRESLETIPMQNSNFQHFTFSIFMLSLYCAASMLPCGRYYYEPEGGYVGNPWVKLSYQYAYVYLIWLIHHLDEIDNTIFGISRRMKAKVKELISRSAVRSIFNFKLHSYFTSGKSRFRK